MFNSEPFAALKRLVQIAEHDTGQSIRVRKFLLAWANANRDGGFDFTDIWALDEEIAADIVAVVALIAARPGIYPDAYVARNRIEALVEKHTASRV